MPTPSTKRISGRDNREFKRFLAVRARKERDLILVEGPKLLEEATRSRLRVVLIAVDDTIPRPEWKVEPHPPLVHFAAPLMKTLSEVESHQGVIALVERPRPSRDWLALPKVFVLVLDGIQDPGNVGTLIRTAEAAGISGTLLTRGCADPFSPKALRASAGSVFRLPYVPDLPVHGLLALIPAHVQLAAAVAGARGGARSLFEAPLTLPLALALGSEGSGLHPGVEAAASVKVRVPTAGNVESLNVAAAGAIALFEIARRAGTLRN